MRGDEVGYYRAVEDHFARLRGTSFLFTPKDFALLRQWWCEDVPLAAVMAGIGEAMAKRRERGEDPVSSLAYCRHAVTRHGKRLLAAAVGGSAPRAGLDVPTCLRSYAEAVRAAAERWSDSAALAQALTALADAVMTLPTDAPVVALEATATALEASALEAAALALPEPRRAALIDEVRVREDEAGGADALGATARMAIRVRAAREALELPRLELIGDATEN